VHEEIGSVVFAHLMCLVSHASSPRLSMGEVNVTVFGQVR